MSAKLSTIASVTAITAVAAAITGGTYAVFSDRDTVADYGLSNGTLNIDLTNDAIGNNAPAASTPFVLGNMQPGDDGSKDINVTNSGSLPGALTVSLVDLVQLENGCNDPETEAGDVTCGANDASELASQLQITITGPDGADANDTARDVLYSGLLSNYTHNTEARAMDADGSAFYTVSWRFIDDAADANDTVTANNLAQSDSVQFDLQFDIVDTAAVYGNAASLS